MGQGQSALPQGEGGGVGGVGYGDTSSPSPPPPSSSLLRRSSAQPRRHSSDGPEDVGNGATTTRHHHHQSNHQQGIVGQGGEDLLLINNSSSSTRTTGTTRTTNKVVANDDTNVGRGGDGHYQQQYNSNTSGISNNNGGGATTTRRGLMSFRSMSARTVSSTSATTTTVSSGWNVTARGGAAGGGGSGGKKNELKQQKEREEQGSVADSHSKATTAVTSNSSSRLSATPKLIRSSNQETPTDTMAVTTTTPGTSTDLSSNSSHKRGGSFLRFLRHSNDPPSADSQVLLRENGTTMQQSLSPPPSQPPPPPTLPTNPIESRGDSIIEKQNQSPRRGHHNSDSSERQHHHDDDEDDVYGDDDEADYDDEPPDLVSTTHEPYPSRTSSNNNLTNKNDSNDGTTTNVDSAAAASYYQYHQRPVMVQSASSDLDLLDMIDYGRSFTSNLLQDSSEVNFGGGNSTSSGHHGPDDHLFQTPTRPGRSHPHNQQRHRGSNGHIDADVGNNSSTTPNEFRVSFNEHQDAGTPDDDRMNVSFSDPEGQTMLYYRRSSVDSNDGSQVSDMDEDEFQHDFYPPISRNQEWMGRSIENLILGHISRAPVLQLLDGENDWEWDDGTAGFTRRRSTASTFGGGGRRRSSAGSFTGGRRGSLSLHSGVGGAHNMMHGGTLANYYTRRRQMPTDVDRSGFSERQGRRSSTSHGPMVRRRGSIMTSGPSDTTDGPSASATPGGSRMNAGPNAVLSLMARESTGRSCFARGIPAAQCLRKVGGSVLFFRLDQPAAGMASEVAFLAAAIDTGDWSETHSIISRLAVRMIGDPHAMMNPDGTRRAPIEDPNLPPTAPRFYAGGGRLGLERDAFVLAGGVEVMIRMFREKSFVGQEMADSYDARDLSEEIVSTRLAACWNEALAALRELVYFIPKLVEDRLIDDHGDFLPFLFTLLAHDSCFDAAATLIEEILSLMSQTPQPTPFPDDEGMALDSVLHFYGRSYPATTFYLGDVPDLYKLWGSFSCRQLAHFCRILALLVFEPEDRQLLESPAVLKSLELLQLRRNRAVRAGRDSTVDMNQSILLGDELLMKRLLQLLSVMNFAPPLRRFTPYHVMAHFPFITETLIMLGLTELTDWDDIDRHEQLTRKLLEENSSDDLLLSDLGSVANMLESLSETLMGNNRQNTTQIGHIIDVISAAQEAGVIVGRSGRRRRDNRNGPAHSSTDASTANEASTVDPSDRVRIGISSVDEATIQGLASVAGVFSDQILIRRLQNPIQGMEAGSNDGSIQMLGFGIGGGMQQGPGDDGHRNDRRMLINTPEDAANCLQLNAMLLGPYQVEVLFVLCTLLGGRRKLDAQDMLNELGLISILDDMFQRLPWYRRRSANGQGVEETPTNDQPNGIHGPGCECTPESALCVQYLRLLHNFCDRDCDNYTGRQLLLSADERQFIFSQEKEDHREIAPGLLSKIVQAFIRESDESPYRFWLASCIESHLRGSSPNEQMFVALSGLLDHLVADITSERLHCAGSLQTSFDLLGELSKGNANVVQLLVHDLDEERFRKLMSVAAANLVDSNVFIRSLLLSLERLSARDGLIPLYLDSSNPDYAILEWKSETNEGSRSYLTHSWWDVPTFSLLKMDADKTDREQFHDDHRESDWFPTREVVALTSLKAPEVALLPTGLSESVGYFGWVFTPAGDALTAAAYLPNTVERLSWFLAANQARLLRDLLSVVDLRNINHENICCLNTAVVIAIFAHRRKQLAALLGELRHMNDEEKESKRRAFDAARQDDVVDRAFVQAMRYLDLDQQRETPYYARRASLLNSGGGSGSSGGGGLIGDRHDVMSNFREVLWFWIEYYTHRGRDRLSLEFSSHIRFNEWKHVVSLLVADDGSATALVRAPPRLPRSPYQRASRAADYPFRGVH